MTQKTKTKTSKLNGSCPIGPLHLHTLNYERDECIWCGPNELAWKPGVWVQTDIGNAWSTDPANFPGRTVYGG